MLTDYEKIDGKDFCLDLVDRTGVRTDGTFTKVDMSLVKPFIDMVQQRKLGGHESVLVGYRMSNGESDHLFIVGKTAVIDNGVFKVEHWNYHEKRGKIAKTHETQKVCTDENRILSIFYDWLFDVIDKDIPATLNALRRLYITRGVWQSYDCPMCGCDFDLEDERMVHIGQQFVCSCETVLEATDELIESFETNGDLMTFPPNPRTASALAAFRKNT